MIKSNLKKRVRKAVIPAAGLGTRFLPATKAQPKEMLPVVDKPAIQYIVEEAVASGIEDIIIITGRGKRAIEDHFDKAYELESILEGKMDFERLREIREIVNLVDIHYIRQREPKGLGHAVYCARKFVGDEPFAVLLGDDIVVSETPCLRQLIEVYDEYGGTVLGVQEVPTAEVSRYGIVAPKSSEEIKPEHRQQVWPVQDLVEKPSVEKAPSNIAILGRYIIQPKVFHYLEKQTPGAGGEIQLTDALRKLREVGPLYAYSFEGRRYDIGTKLGYLQATVEIALEREDLKDEFADYLKGLLG
ncbi:MAG: UTP--glucose-1-phosphate uridylyltransferase GalU [Syntrophomonadaceae bacterium]|nr:UTP--glucose-1-phosphate uridylyltransferase GalU [Syntrophomonadaceae bacterium]